MSEKEHVLYDEGFCPTLPPIPPYTEEERAKQIEAGKKFKEDLAAAVKRGDAFFRIQPGEYRFPDNTGFCFDQISNMEIDATGATFWMERPENLTLDNPIGITVSHCDHLVLKGLTLDFDPPLFIQGKVTSFDYTAEKPYIDFIVDDGYPFVDHFTGQLLLYRPDGHIMPQDVLYTDDVVKLGKGREMRVYSGNGEKANGFAVGNFNPGVKEALGERAVLHPGDYVTLPFRRGSSYNVHHSKRCEFRDLTIFASPGMGVVEGFCEANLYDGVKIIRRPNTSRLLAGMADTFHGYCDSIGPTIRHCEFSHNCDDFINLHGFFSVVLKKVAPCQYILSPMVGEEYEPGMKLDFSDFRTMHDHGSATVVSSVELPEYRQDIVELLKEMKVHPHGGLRPQLVTLDRDVAAVRTSLVDINGLNCQGFLIEDNYFHSSMGRALLLSGAKGGVARNNLWRELDGGVYIFMESHYYMEGQFPKDIVLENNRFEDILGYCSRQIYPYKLEQGFITVGLIPPDQYLRKDIVKIENIVIRNNYLENPPALPILLVYTDKAEITGNTVVNPYCLWDAAEYRTTPNFFEEDPDSVVYASTCRNLKVHGNRVLFTGKERSVPVFRCKYCENVESDE